MGDPRKQRKRYSRPKHPWRANRILEETELGKRYGLKNKKEIWKANSVVGRFRQQARTLLGAPGKDSEKGSKELIEKLNGLGITNTQSLEDVLALTVEDLLKRRLQSLVVSKGVTNSLKQARQLIIHKNILLGDRIVSVPSYIVPKGEEDRIKLKEGVKVIKGAKKMEAPEEKPRGPAVPEKPKPGEKRPEAVKKEEKPSAAEDKKKEAKPKKDKKSEEKPTKESKPEKEEKPKALEDKKSEEKPTKESKPEKEEKPAKKEDE